MEAVVSEQSTEKQKKFRKYFSPFTMAGYLLLISALALIVSAIDYTFISNSYVRSWGDSFFYWVMAGGCVLVAIFIFIAHSAINTTIKTVKSIWIIEFLFIIFVAILIILYNKI
ncbi:MAG: hypothetical protein WBP45_06510 [Daejeonella sp.]